MHWTPRILILYLPVLSYRSFSKTKKGNLDFRIEELRPDYEVYCEKLKKPIFGNLYSLIFVRETVILPDLRYLICHDDLYLGDF